MLTTSVFLIAWLMGFLVIFSRFEKSQQIHNGAMTIDREKRFALGMGLVAYIGVTLALGLTYIIAS